ncbi:MAG: hypothetical protein SFU25_12195 [Candidatus Caenarcaniphilales bacterium]|nr:hypothetical protein [Candidatus Caenarcaniphilales bacterium]
MMIPAFIPTKLLDLSTKDLGIDSSRAPEINRIVSTGKSWGLRGGHLDGLKSLLENPNDLKTRRLFGSLFWTTNNDDPEAMESYNNCSPKPKDPTIREILDYLLAQQRAQSLNNFFMNIGFQFDKFTFMLKTKIEKLNAHTETFSSK